jgi:hypothetical protein
LRLILFVLLLQIPLFGMALTSGEKLSPIVGSWQYYKYIYKGNTFFPRDTETKLFYDFSENGQSALVWKNDVDNIYCERRGLYFLNDGKIHDEVVWLSPKNTRDCSRDPDMRLGNKSVTNYRINSESDLEIDIAVADEFLAYVFKKIEP